MAEEEPTLVPIGVAHTPYETPKEAPHQGFADDAEAEIAIFEAYAEELSGIEEVLRVTIVYWAHLADRTPAGEGERSRGNEGNDGSDRDREGAFTRRGPSRPNPLSICTCTVLGVEGRRLRVSGLDAVDGSPVIDIKPALQAER
jgi:tRNA-Thr(GGU) m(6)t(6)A37 methyltransferase TsaA